MTKVALFDFCETLVNFQTADRFVDFVRERTQSKRMRVWDWIRLLLIKFRFFRVLGIFAPKNNWHKRLKMYQLRGFSQQKLNELSIEYYHSEIRPNLIIPIKQELEKKQKQGMVIGIVSGGFSIYIQPFCKEFGISKIVTTDIGFTAKGRCTGRIKGIDCMHSEKITKLREVLDFSRVDWENSIAYSDSITDLPLLTIVGEGIVVSKTILKKIYRKTWLGKVVLQPFGKIYRYLEYKLIPDEIFLKRKFKQTQGFALDLKNPQTLNAKMQWLKINDLTPLHTLCADKYGVREFVEKEVGKEYLVPVLFRTHNPKELTKENLPQDTNFIIKTTHDSSGGFIIRGNQELEKIDFKALQKRFSHLLQSKHYRGGRENQYRDIKPQIIVEQLLEDNKGKIPNDYKFHCFNGKPQIVYVSVDREGKNKRNIYDMDWNPLHFTWLAPGKDASNLRGEEIEKPQNYEQMIQIAEKLASHFLYVRVDLYNVEGKIYVGELTFHHGSGFEHIRPIEWDYKMGAMLKLPFE